MGIAGWIIFNAFILLVLALDLFVFHKKGHAVSFKEALIWSAIWVALSLAFNAYIWFAMGREAGISFFTGYLIEKSLSIDNLFVFLLIFEYFHTPESSLHKVLFWGILGAIVARAVFILLGVAVIQKFHPIIYLFGLFLVFTGIKLGLNKNKKIHPEKNLLLRFFRRYVPMTQDYENDRFFVVRNGSFFATPLAIVLLSIETTDIIFAVDSIPAILAITLDPFIVFTSNIFAILGLRSLFFVLAGSLKLFRYLHYGIAAVLVFVGIKMLVSDILKISPLIALGIVFIILFATILASLLIKREKIN